MPMKTTTVLALSALALALPARAQSAQEIFEEVERRQDQVRAEEARIRMEIVDAKGRARTREMTVYGEVDRDDRQRSLVVFTGPADIRGTGLLTVEGAGGDDQRLFLPALGRVQRIAGGKRGERFAGSDFSYEDLGSRDPERYTATLVRTTPQAWTIAVQPKPGTETGYARIVLTVDRATYTVRRADYEDARGRTVKRLTAEDFVEVAPGAFRANRMTMADLEADRKTVLTFTQRKAGDIDDDVFSERTLQRGVR